MPTKNPFKILNSKAIYNNNWIEVTEHQVINPAGGNGIYGEVHFKNLALGILVLDDEMNTWLVGQYRFPLKAYSWEIPEGGGALNEPPLQNAQRELKEETGLTAKKWTEIQRMHLSNSVSDELAIIYLAQNLQMGVAQPEDTEQLVVKKLPFTAAYAMVLNGEITDSMSVAAILKTNLLITQGNI